MATGHTAGPFTADGREITAVIGGRRMRVGVAAKWIVPVPDQLGARYADRRQAEANARLFAAAPAMLAALKLILAGGSAADWQRGQDAAKAAVKLAEGG